MNNERTISNTSIKHKDNVFCLLYQDKATSIELIVRVININDNSTSDILTKCSTLHDYMIFVNKVRIKKNHYKDIRLAVTEAVDECIAENILSDFFIEHRMDSFQEIQNYAFYTSLNPNFFSILKNKRKNPKILRFLDFSAIIILFDPN